MSRGQDKVRYVFVCGMPRSGTTVLARQIAGLENCTGFENTGVVMDEGQYLQDVYPTEWACGGAGRFGFAPQAHLTEASPLLTPGNVSRLRQSWEAYWDRNKTIRVEKTPSNLLKTRFLQAAFPGARFIVIKRHPVAASLATQKWSRTPLHDLFEHWLRCHALYDEDKKRLEHVYELRYEDYVGDPKKYLAEIANFIGAEFTGVQAEEATEAHNKRYFERWARLLESSPFRPYYGSLLRRFEARFREHGYSLIPASAGAPLPAGEISPARGAGEALLYLGADIGSVFWRLGSRLRERAAVVGHRYFPERIRPLGVAKSEPGRQSRALGIQ